jgi:glutathione S-transferase
VIPGSARIIETLERLKPAPPLYPADPDLRRRALEIERRFDDEIGPAVRAAVFSRMLEDPGTVCRVFADAHPLPVRLLYRAMLPVGRKRIRQAYRLDDPQGVREAFAKTREGLDFVAKQAGPDGFLVGDAFSVADLTAASLLALCCDPPDCDMSRPRPTAECMKRWLAEWAEHPGTGWVLRMYREHRPPAAALAESHPLR